MPQEIHVNNAVLTKAAGNHQETSDYLATVSASHEGIRTMLSSLGPIYGDLRQAADSMLDARKGCYDSQAGEHSDVAGNLHGAVSTWNKHEDDAARSFRNLNDGR